MVRIFITAHGQPPICQLKYFPPEILFRKNEYCVFDKPLQSSDVYAAFWHLLQNRMGPRQALDWSWRQADAATFSSLHSLTWSQGSRGSHRYCDSCFPIFPRTSDRCCFYSWAVCTQLVPPALSPGNSMGLPWFLHFPSGWQNFSPAACTSMEVLIEHLSSCSVCTPTCLVSVHSLSTPRSDIWLSTP